MPGKHLFQAAFCGLVFAATLSGCGADAEDPTLVVDANELPFSDVGESQLAPPPADECANRWDLSPEAEAAGSAANIPYEYSYGCVGFSQPGAVELGDFLNQTFPTGTAGYGVYRCQVLTSPYYSLHSEGRAIDFMIRTDNNQYGGAANNVGDPIANWLIENADVIGVQSIIWDRTIWRSSYWPRDHCVDASNPHWDHLHIELTWDAAHQLTPWYYGAATTPLPGAGPAPGAAPDHHVDPPGTFIVDSNNAYNTWAWGADPSPSWTGGSVLPGSFNNGYWTAPTAFFGLDFMDFWFLRGETSCLSAWTWYPQSASNAPDTFFIAYNEPAGHTLGYYAGLVELGRATVDQRAGGNQWNYLGSFEFPPLWNKISVDRWTNSLVGNAVADAVKLIPSGLCSYTPSPGQIVIDDNNANNNTASYYAYVPPSWSYEGWVVPAWQFGSYQAQTSFWGLDFADFQFYSSTQTCYDVDAWWTENANNAPDTYFIAYHSPGAAIQGYTADLVEIGRTTANQTVNGSKWNRLGTWSFPTGWNKIAVDRWTDSLVGYAVADAVRLTPSNGCPVVCPDTDHDGITDCNETCPTDPAKSNPGACGCGVPDTDTDHDSQADCVETCDTDPYKAAPGICGCGVADTNSDGDAMADCQETCDTDPAKTAPGVCGCGVADTNTDGDAMADCQETCDADPRKTAPGICGCGVADTNTDGDVLADCQETCDTDPLKTAPGFCGCGVPDVDLTGDGVPDCAVCGNGQIEPPETCDDGNLVTGDGCSATCALEAAPSLRAPTPGTAGVRNTFRATSFPPGDNVIFLASSQRARTNVPGCPGLTIPLANPVVIGTASANISGTASLSVTVPANAAGHSFAFIAVDRTACVVSNAPSATFQ